MEAVRLKTSAARRQFEAVQSLPEQRQNGDERRYRRELYYASHFKCLPQNDFGEVDRVAFRTYAQALDRCSMALLERVPLDPVAVRKLANPLGAFRYEMQGLDGWSTRMPPAPTFRSATTAAEMVELYWSVLLRDTPFTDYDSSSLVADAVADVNALSATVGPTNRGVVTPGTLFRGETPGDVEGPYISQLMLLPVNNGPAPFEQIYESPVAGSDFMIDAGDWVNVQRGGAPAESAAGTRMGYLNNLRALSEYVHNDVVWQAYYNAAIILLGLGPDALEQNNPYLSSSNQGAFSSFGPPWLLHLLTYAGNLSLQGAWYQKWLVHRRLRPETYGGRLQFHVTGQRVYEIHPDLPNSAAVARTHERFGSYFLGQAYPEGSPTHPAYPAGHATIAGACCTVLKAFFQEDYEFVAPVEASSDGSALQAYTGGDKLTVGGEINKLAANVALGRDAAGVHYRSDGIDGLATGEQQALTLLAEHSLTFKERFDGFRLTRFDGTPVKIQNGRVIRQ